MRAVLNDKLRDTIRTMCKYGIDYYEVVNTSNDMVVAVSREREQVNKICDEFNKKFYTVNFKVNFINN